MGYCEVCTHWKKDVLDNLLGVCNHPSHSGIETQQDQWCYSFDSVQVIIKESTPSNTPTKVECEYCGNTNLLDNKRIKCYSCDTTLPEVTKEKADSYLDFCKTGWLAPVENIGFSNFIDRVAIRYPPKVTTTLWNSKD